MRTALCISGELRSYDITYEELKNHIIDPLSADVFVYSWNSIGGTRKKRATSNIYNKFLVDDFRRHKYLDKNDFIESVKHVYKPRKIGLEDYKEEYQNKIEDVERPEEFRNDKNLAGWCKHDLSMFYTLYKCNELKKEAEEEDGLKYDLVIKARPDIRFPNFKRMPINEEVLEKGDTLWYWPKDHNESHTVSDKFAFSNSKIMDHYSSVFTYLNLYWSEGLIVEKIQQPKISEHILWQHFHERSKYTVKSFGNDYYDAPRARAIRRKLEEKLSKSPTEPH